MVDYYSALNTSLHDYAELRAAQEETTLEAVLKGVEIVPVRVQGRAWAGSLFGGARLNAISEFDTATKGLIAVVELREGIGDVGIPVGIGMLNSYYVISGTGLRRRDSPPR